MIVGIDFDNTLVCYDGLFHAAALEWGLIPENLGKSKQDVRSYLRNAAREEDFTRLQGFVYGPGIMNASPYPHVMESIKTMTNVGIEICIISHKTRTPILGPAWDLHQYALEWLHSRQFFAEGMLSPSRVFLEESKEAKALRAGHCGCTYFIDDLPEFFMLPQFPADTRQILFSPNHKEAKENSGYVCFSSWKAISQYCLANYLG